MRTKFRSIFMYGSQTFRHVGRSRQYPAVDLRSRRLLPAWVWSHSTRFHFQQPRVDAKDEWVQQQQSASTHPSVLIKNRQSLTYSPSSAPNSIQQTQTDQQRNVQSDLGHASHTNNTNQLRWKVEPEFDISSYKDLSKAKLAALVALTAMAGYAVAPGAADVSRLLWTTLGTGLCISSANAINQWVEAPYDAQMSRTRNRVLVRHALSPAHAFLAGTTAGITGTALLYVFVNPVAAALAGSNIILYTCVYTPMKRTSVANTWVGSIVGAIPPMIGWAACSGSIDSGAWLLAAVLYAWQFPHFNALAWNLRPDYSKAGYRMISVTDPALNSRVALRYALLMFPISYAACWIGLTTPWFLFDSSLVNAYMAWCAWRFWRNTNDKTARTLFFASLVHLPVFLVLMMIHKAHPADPDTCGDAISSETNDRDTTMLLPSDPAN